MAKKPVCNFNYSQPVLVNESLPQERPGLLPNSDFNTACRRHLTFDKVEPLTAPERSQIKAFLHRLNGQQQSSAAAVYIMPQSWQDVLTTETPLQRKLWAGPEISQLSPKVSDDTWVNTRNPGSEVHTCTFPIESHFSRHVFCWKKKTNFWNNCIEEQRLMVKHLTDNNISSKGHGWIFICCTLIK